MRFGIFAILTLLLFFTNIKDSFAATVIAETFDNYTNNSLLCGQGAWYSSNCNSNSVYVKTTPSGFTANQGAHVGTSIQAKINFDNSFEANTDDLSVTFDYFSTSTSASGGMGILWEQPHAQGDVSCYVYVASNNWKISDTNFSTQYTITSAADSTWYNINLEYRHSDGNCRATINGVASSWYDFGNGTTTVRVASSTLTLIGPSSRQWYLDNLLVYTNHNTDVSTTSVECYTCTRVVTTDPDTGETLASTTNGYNVIVNYYVAEEDFCDVLCTTYIELRVGRTLSLVNYNFSAEVDQLGLNNISHWFAEINATGTHVLSIHIYNKYSVLGWSLNIGDFTSRFTLLQEIRKFYVGEETASSTLQEFYQDLDAVRKATSDAYEEGSADPGSADNPGTIASALKDTAYNIMLLPPIGYVTYFNEVIANGTSSELGVMSLTMPTSSPLAGSTFTLDIEGGAQEAISIIRSTDGATSFGDSWDTVMHYWSLFWYMLLVLWIVKEILGLSYGFGGSKEQEYQKTGVINYGGGNVTGSKNHW